MNGRANDEVLAEDFALARAVRSCDYDAARLGDWRVEPKRATAPSADAAHRQGIGRARGVVERPVEGVSWVGFHAFCHTCAKLLFAEGRNAVQVQRWLGHHSPAFTLRIYVHLLDGDIGEPLALPASPNTCRPDSYPSGLALDALGA